MKNLVLIVGGTSGIGLETARYLSKKNYKVIISGRSKIKENLTYIETDVCNEHSVKKLSKKIYENYGYINSLVFTAATTVKKSRIDRFSENKLTETLDTNLFGFLRLIKFFYPALKETKGRVVAVNSIAGKTYSEFSGIEYVSSKGALSAAVRQLSMDLAEEKILINSVFPSMTQTKMLIENVEKQNIEQIQKKIPLRKLATPFDTARAIEFLISDENNYITGTGIDISGGIHLSG